MVKFAIILVAILIVCARSNILLKNNNASLKLPIEDGRNLDELFVSSSSFGSVVAALSPIDRSGLGTYFVSVDQGILGRNFSVDSTLVLPLDCRSSSVVVNASNFVSFCTACDPSAGVGVFSVNVLRSGLLSLAKSSKVSMATVVLGFDGKQSIYFLSKNKDKEGMSMNVMDTNSLSYQRHSIVRVASDAEFYPGVIVGGGRYAVCSYMVAVEGAVLRIDLTNGVNKTLHLGGFYSTPLIVVYNDSLGYIVNTTSKGREYLVRIHVVDFLAWRIVGTFDLPTSLGGAASALVVSQTSLFIGINHAHVGENRTIVQVRIEDGFPKLDELSTIIATPYWLAVSNSPSYIYWVSMYGDSLTYFFVERYKY